jgi:hypothetical protein
MATQARGAATKVKNQMMAQRMKDLKIRRTTGRCCVCYRVVGIPMDNHYAFGCN